ncbi:MAG: ATP-binding protein [Bacteroidota bacterium]|nr:ATP-binding protein [Bacteroidota bacterium]
MQKNASISETEYVMTQPQISQSEYYYKQLIQELSAAIYTCDKQGHILFYNKAAIDLWGRKPEIGKDLWCGSWKIYQPDGAPLSLDACPMAIALKTGQSVRGQEIVIERPNGVRLNVLPHPDPILDDEGNVIGAVNMLVDITEHKQTKEANLLLKEYNEKLEQFAYAASHDMQEPLRKIYTFSNLLLERNGEQLNEQGKMYISKITHSAQRMSSIINDLLDYSRNSRPDDQFIETDLNRIIEDIKSDLELLITNKEAEISCSTLPAIKAIPSQINRLFYNLIQNALKFSKKDRSPLINISVSNHLYSNMDNQSFIEINVQDNGIGFDQKYADKVFNLFQRLNDKQSYSGNGIGLALCKKIVENHYGQISVQSEIDKGTCFSIKFPIGLLID